MSLSTEGSANGLRIRVDGSVQGVGFRPWVYSLATGRSLKGRVWNDGGTVRIEAFGASSSLFEFLDTLRQPPMPAATVRELFWESIPSETLHSFDIVASRGSESLTRRPAIPPDLALCDACRDEMGDPSDRRHGYAFINCTHCGPRYTICRDVPYDRDQTTMGEFPMCDACRAEYSNPADRRFHAQPVACPQCGPTLQLIDAGGRELATGGDAIAATAALLRRGAIVAVKGLGGFHLACDAGSCAAVAELRRRKARDAKPFAVMVADLEQAERLAFVDDDERGLLTSAARPIVLLARRDQSASDPERLAPALAPHNPSVGLVLPYTPMHELLLAAVGRPLVMTSGNRSDEPMVTEDADARTRLAGEIADAVLLHDRAIANRCDDSVTRILDGAAVVLRRGRGWVPSSLTLAAPTPKAVLACGGHLKNTVCFAQNNLAWLGPHVGDLETHEACVDYETMTERFGRFVGITPEVIACDLHPDYFSTRWAIDHAANTGLPLLRVQHHHAHVAAAMAEHGLRGPVLGLAWDGTGYGGDGSAWGGELLYANYAGFERLATFRPIALAGGDLAIREVWRIALAALDDAFFGATPVSELALFDNIGNQRIGLVRQMIEGGIRAPLAHGVGRWFDAIGALALALPESRFEGEVAMRLGFAAETASRDQSHCPGSAYDFALDERGDTSVIDLRHALREVVCDLLNGSDVGSIAMRFHATLVSAAVAVVERAVAELGDLPVVLTGGCFQNERLLAGVHCALGRARRVYVHRTVPPNDGGIALGQAAIAAALIRGESGPGRNAPAAAKQEGM